MPCKELSTDPTKILRHSTSNRHEPEMKIRPVMVIDVRTLASVNDVSSNVVCDEGLVEG
jgi:hypothetical protein